MEHFHLKGLPIPRRIWVLLFSAARDVKVNRNTRGFLVLENS